VSGSTLAWALVSGAAPSTAIAAPYKAVASVSASASAGSGSGAGNSAGSGAGASNTASAGSSAATATATAKSAGVKGIEMGSGMKVWIVVLGALLYIR